jgi:ribulose kinase
MYAKVAHGLPPGRYRQLVGIARNLVVQQQLSPSRSILQVQSQLQAAVSLGGASVGDIAMEAFIVLMTACNDMDDDLQNVMNETQERTWAKQQFRALISQVNQLVASESGQTYDSLQQVLYWLTIIPDWPRGRR